MIYLRRIGWTAVLVVVSIVKSIALGIIAIGWAFYTSAIELRDDLRDLWAGKAD